MIANKAKMTGQMVAKPARLSSVVLGAEPATGNAIASVVLEDYTFSNATENGIPGTMPNIGAQNITPTASDIAISEGYHDGSGVVSGAPIANAKAAIDAANEEVSADLDTGIALVASNYSDIKDAIEAKGVDMTGVIPSDYDDAIASIPAPTGDAVAGDLLAGKTASTAAGAITGTRPCSPVLKTGQTTSYVDYDDGYYEAGEECSGARFTDNGDGTVTDNNTGLMWPKDLTAGTSKNWSDSIAYAETLELGGHTDWRLPNAKELLSVMNYGTANPALPAGHPFTVTSVNYLWSSTTRLTTPANAFYVFFGDGSLAQTAKTNNWPHTAWPVRGPIAL